MKIDKHENKDALPISFLRRENWGPSPMLNPKERFVLLFFFFKSHVTSMGTLLMKDRNIKVENTFKILYPNEEEKTKAKEWNGTRYSTYLG